MPSASNVHERYKRARFKHDLGFKVRNFMQRIISAVYPYAKKVLPNFRAVHYFYILSHCFIGSILIYPVKSIPYIDALFFASGASTQAGLNTVDVNKASLYQQIILYIIPCLTNPIFIHGSLLLVRLYYFERHFDNIKENSKLNFQMRKSATLARQNTIASANSTRINTAANKDLGYNHKDDEVESPQSSSLIPGNGSNNQNGKTEHMSEPSDDEDDLGGNVEDKTAPSHAIKFGALPHPRRRKSIDPEDMFRSINMLREKQKSQNNTHNKNDNQEGLRPPQSTSIHFADMASPSRTRRSRLSASASQSPHNEGNGDGDDDDDDDDVLVIKPPNEIEDAASHNAIFTKKKLSKPHQKRRSLWIPLSSRKTHKPWKNRLRRTLSNSSRKRRSQASSELEDEVDDDASIDSEVEESNISGDDATRFDGRSGVETGDDDDDDDDDDDYDGEVDESAVTDDEDLAEGDISPTQLAQNSRRHSASNDPESGNTTRTLKFDHALPDKERERRRKRRFKKLKRIRTPIISRLSSGDTAANNDDEDTEESDESDDDDYRDGLARTMSGNYLSFAPTVGRNSTFMKMTDEQKDELGGIEYRAVKLLIKIIVCYYLGFLIVPSFMLLIWVYCMPGYKTMLNDSAITPGWWAFYTAQSSFNDLGLTLTADSMNSFHENAFVQVLCGFLIVIGNTGFPIFLRFIIWIMFKTAPELSLYKESLGFLLDHPRRCFTLLFPLISTWWLFFILVALNGFDLVIWCIVDLNSSMFDGVPKGYRVLNGLFQALCTRTVGFSIVDLSQLHAATQVGYLVMMYISVLPIAISVRRTNVYEEQSLGVYTKESNEGDENTPSNFVGAHLRNQLSYDLWYIFLGLFIICLAEGSKLQKQEFRFSVFAVLFEVISAYGTVGMSLGYPDVNTSLTGKFNVISKLVIIAMMIRGRHRGLPYAIDRAILLPNAEMSRHDEVQEQHAMNRQNTLDRGTTLARVATFARGGPIDGGDNILSRVLTNVSHLRNKRKRNRGSTSSNNNGDTRDGEQSLHSSNPNYLVTTVSHV